MSLKTIVAATSPWANPTPSAPTSKTSPELGLCQPIACRRLVTDRSHIQPTAAICRWSREHGITWHQQTVTRVEAGMQQLRAAELVALAEILRTTMDRFTWMQPEASATEYVYSAGTRVRRTSEDVSVAVHMLLSALSSAERTIEMTKDSKYERVHEARRESRTD